MDDLIIGGAVNVKVIKYAMMFTACLPLALPKPD
jgi:hypothetical protein